MIKMFIRNPITILLLLVSILLLQSTEANAGEFCMHLPPGSTLDEVFAMHYCKQLAEKAWKPIVDIQVNISFKKWDRTSLAVAKTTKWHVISGVYYPLGLAKQIIGKDINKDMEGSRRYDVEMAFHDMNKWHWGMNGKPAAGKYDLVSTCLHEIWHGVHMTSLGYEVKRVGGHLEAVPRHPTLTGSYDEFITFETTDGQNCPLSSIRDDPRKLATALTGGNLWFSTSEGRIARLYAPKKFSPSSVTHLDFHHYDHENGLMKSHHGAGEANHSPGPVVIRMLQTMLDPYAIPVFECITSVVPKSNVNQRPVSH